MSGGVLLALGLFCVIRTGSSSSTSTWTSPWTDSQTPDTSTTDNTEAISKSTTDGAHYSVNPTTSVDPFLPTTEPCLRCTNGVSSGKCQINATCDCQVQSQPFFSGDFCESVLLEVTNQTSTARTINITWPAEPNIDAGIYSFVYRNNGTSPIDQTLDVPEVGEEAAEHVYMSPFSMLDPTTARLINLNITTWYVVCVMPTEQAENLTATNNISGVSEDLPECVRIDTVDNVTFANTLAAFIIAGLMIALIIVLIIAKLFFDKSMNKNSHDIYYDGKRKSKAPSDSTRLTDASEPAEDYQPTGGDDNSIINSSGWKQTSPKVALSTTGQVSSPAATHSRLSSVVEDYSVASFVLTKPDAATRSGAQLQERPRDIDAPYSGYGLREPQDRVAQKYPQPNAHSSKQGYYSYDDHRQEGAYASEQTIPDMYAYDNGYQPNQPYGRGATPWRSGRDDRQYRAQDPYARESDMAQDPYARERGRAQNPYSGERDRVQDPYARDQDYRVHQRDNYGAEGSIYTPDADY